MHSILVLTSTYPRWSGDTEPAFVHYLCKELASDYRVIVLAPHYRGARSHELLDGIKVHRFRYFFPRAERLAYDGGILTNLRHNRLKLLLVPFFAASQFVMLVRLCRRYRVSLIHAHWFIPQGLLAILARTLFCGRVKVLSTSHGADLFALRGGLMQGLKRLVARHSSHVTVVSDIMKRRLQELGCDPGSISVLPMGVDLKQRFVPDPGVARQTDLVFVGRLVEKKGVATLLEALALLHTEFPRLQLAVVGEGPDRKALQALAGKLGIDAQVAFSGAVENSRVPYRYQSARIAVIPSVVAEGGDQEGLGLVAVEALGCGCATIVSDLPALGDVVRHEENGLVFRAGDAGDLAQQIRRLLTDTELCQRLAASGRTSVADRFDWQQVGTAYTELIGRCLAPASRP